MQLRTRRDGTEEFEEAQLQLDRHRQQMRGAEEAVAALRSELHSGEQAMAALSRQQELSQRKGFEIQLRTQVRLPVASGLVVPAQTCVGIEQCATGDPSVFRNDNNVERDQVRLLQSRGGAVGLLCNLATCRPDMEIAVNAALGGTLKNTVVVHTRQQVVVHTLLHGTSLLLKREIYWRIVD